MNEWDKTTTQGKPRVYRVGLPARGTYRWCVDFGLQFCVESFEYWEMAMLRTKFPPVGV